MADGWRTLGREGEANGLRKPAIKFGQDKWSQCEELRPPSGGAEDLEGAGCRHVMLVNPSE